MNKIYKILFFFIYSFCTLNIIAQDTYIDDFNPANYSGNDGTQSFLNPWDEDNDDDNPSSGKIQISGQRLEFEDLDVNDEAIERNLDLTGIQSASLIFDWQTDGLDGNFFNQEQLDVQASIDGITFVTLQILVGTQIGSSSLDISDYISANTTIRFINLSTAGFAPWEANEFVYIDNLRIRTNDFFIKDATTVNICEGIFYDSGGENQNYQNFENSTYTICADTPGAQVIVDFNIFDLENNFDDLTIYDGNAVVAANVIGTFTGTNSPGTVTSTLDCLTFVFDSDVSVTNTGWEATISCTPTNPNLSIIDLSVDENAGSITFTITHTGVDTSGAFTVDYTTTNNTATSGIGNDFTAQSGTLSFSGTTGDQETITIPILDDINIEGDETFFIDFSNVSDPLVDISDQGIGTIVDIEIENPRPYTERIRLNLRGDFDMIGNTNLTCTANCASPFTNNPAVVMGYASIDGTTTNSSSANLTLPPGATVAWAGLYWGGVYNSTLAGTTNPPPALNIQQVRLREPGAGLYTTIDASITNIETRPGWNVFMSFADITAIVQGAGSGAYTTADIALITGSAFTGPFGGWTMAIIYEDPTDLTRSVTIWDGFDFFGFGANDSFTLTGILTPTIGTFDTKTGYFGMDGEASPAFSGDFVSINSTPLSNALNPADNTLNSTISTFGVDLGARNPNQSFNWGIDIDIFDSTGFIPNNATTATIDLGSLNEGIWGGVFANSTEVAFPTVASKNFSPTQIGFNEESTVTITLENPSNGVDLTNLSLTDALPAGMIISTTPDTNSSCGGTISAVVGSDNFSISGISLNAGNNCTFTFDVIGIQLGDHVNSISTADISNDQSIPLAGTTNGTLNVFARTVITNRRITYRVKK